MVSNLSIAPAFNDYNRCIIFSADNGFMALTSVAVQSIIENASPDDKCDFIIIHSNVSEHHQNQFMNLASGRDNVSIRFFDLTSFLDNKTFYVENRPSFTKEAYYRLLIPWILDSAYKDALYIDGDIIARRNIFDIFDIDLGDNLIGAVRDYWGICNCYIPGDDRRSYRESIGLTDIDNYVISATILFNLQLFRDSFEMSYILDLAASKEWLQHDQDVVNILCKDKITYISPTYGRMSDYGNNHYLPTYLQNELKEIEDDPIVAHFGGRRKPYSDSYTDFDIEFWQYADHTPYFNVLLNKVKSEEYKHYVAKIISDGKLEQYVTNESIASYYKGVKLGELHDGHTKIRLVKIKNNILRLEGFVGVFAVDLDCDVKVGILINGVLHEATEQYTDNGMDPKKKIVTYRSEAFTFEYPLDESLEDLHLRIAINIDGVWYVKSNLKFERYCAINNHFKNMYSSQGGWIVKARDYKLIIVKSSLKSKILHEMYYLKELYKKKQQAEKKAMLIRPIVHVAKKLIRKPIWLVSDKLQRADDNGEAFFRYLNKHHKKDVHSFFVINKNSPDYARLKQYGKVVPAYSFQHKLLHLLSSWSISSQTDNVVRNPFHHYSEAYRDILNEVQYVFLQHGIISNDISKFFGRKELQLDGFVTSTKREYLSILNGDYHYDDSEVWLTGLPRFDYLEDKKEKVITVMPTWRLYLTTGQDKNTGFWKVRSDFAESDYVVFYRNLMQHPKLQQAAKRYGYTIQFKAHSAFTNNIADFNFDNEIVLVDPAKSYREIYSKSSLIVTDYSSAIYDFIYLRKPIMYCQADADTFFENHSYSRGDMDYERDGFGEVEYNLEGSVNRIIDYMENECNLKDKYRERIDNFFEFDDRNNCQRVYDEIIKASTNVQTKH